MARPPAASVPRLGVRAANSMVEMLPYLLACLAVLSLFGLPATLVLLPDVWRPWWPVALPLAGLATLVCVMQLLGTLFTAGGTAWVAVGLAVVATGVALATGSRLTRPATWALIVLVVGAGACALALRPSLRLGEPRPSGITNQDAIYYVVLDRWLDRHGIREEPPPPHVDGFWATAHHAWDNHLRVGVDLADVVVARVSGIDPVDVMPVMTAIYTGLVALAVALLVIAMRGPPWAAGVAALLAATRPDLIRLALESNVAQVAGLGLFVVAAAAIALALVSGRPRAFVLAGLLCGGVVGTYVEFAPSLALSTLVTAGLVGVFRLVRAGDDEPETAEEPSAAAWSTVAVRVALIGAATVAINPLAVYHGLRSLLASADLSGLAVLPFLGIARDVGIAAGPDSIVLAAGPAALILAAAAVTLALVGLVEQPRLRIAMLVGGVAGGLGLAAWQAWLQPYSYGLYKSLSLIAPFVAAGLAVTLLVRSTGIRVLAAACIAVLVAVNLNAADRVSLAGVDAHFGMIPDDAKLEEYRSLVPGSKRVAIEGADMQTASNSREHFSVYALRALQGLGVTFPRGTGSYFTTELQVGPVNADQTYRPAYDHVVSFGPSVTHDQLVGQLGYWSVYRRQSAVDVLVVGREGWSGQAAGPWGPVRYTATPPSLLWLNATRPGKVRVSLDLYAPDTPRRVDISLGPDILTTARVGTRPRRVVTPAIDIPAGRTEIALQVRPPGGDPAAPTGAVGLVRARAREVQR